MHYTGVACNAHHKAKAVSRTLHAPKEFGVTSLLFAAILVDGILSNLMKIVAICQVTPVR